MVPAASTVMNSGLAPLASVAQAAVTVPSGRILETVESVRVTVSDHAAPPAVAPRLLVAGCGVGCEAGGELDGAVAGELGQGGGAAAAHQQQGRHGATDAAAFA